MDEWIERVLEKLPAPISRLLVKYREIIAYLFWGVMTTVVSWLTYMLFSLVFRGASGQIHALGGSVPASVVLANALSWVCAVAFAFVVNKLRVFRSPSWEKSVVWPELWKFVASRAATGVLELVGVPAAVALGLNGTLLGVEGMLAKVIVTFIVIVLNYVLSKLFIFRDNTFS